MLKCINHLKDFYINTNNHYVIRDDLERVHIIKKFINRNGKLRKGNHLMSCQKLVRVDSIPSVIQTCVGNFMRKQRFENEMKILGRIFGERFGYVVFSPEEYFVAPLADRIENNNGYLARFPMSKSEFRDELREVLDSSGFKIRTEKRAEARLEAAG